MSGNLSGKSETTALFQNPKTKGCLPPVRFAHLRRGGAEKTTIKPMFFGFWLFPAALHLCGRNGFMCFAKIS
jgi:hypothetical protein